MNELMEKLGLADGASDEEKSAALAKYMEEADANKAKLAKMAEDAEPEKMGDDPAMGDEPDEDDKKMADDPEGEPKMGDEPEMSKLARSLGLPKTATQKQIIMAQQIALAPRTELVTMQKKLAALEAAEVKRMEDAKREKANDLVDGAIKMGKISKEQRANVLKFALENFSACEGFVDGLAVTHVTEQNALQRFTKGGTPVAQQSRKAGEESFVTETRIQGKTVPVRGGEFAVKARAYSKAHKVPLADAQREVLKLHPEFATEIF